MSTNLMRNHCLQETPDVGVLVVFCIWSGVPEAKRWLLRFGLLRCGVSFRLA